MLTIDCINHATIPLDISLDLLIPAMQVYLDHYFSPVWKLGAHLVQGKPAGFRQWTLNFFDHADQADALGYHEDSTWGVPVGKVFVQDSIQNDGTISVCASHELLEMLCDPYCSSCCAGPDGTWYAKEVCDAVENDTLSVNGIKLSDFVTPAWFLQQGKAPFDYLNLLDAPYQLRPGGYISVWSKDQGWQQVFGDEKGYLTSRRKSLDRTSRLSRRQYKTR